MSTGTPAAGTPPDPTGTSGPGTPGTHGTPPDPTPRTSSSAGETPWVETPSGTLFFVNAILVSPIFMALYPWTLRWLLRALDILNRPSRVLDPVPAVADHFIPVLGWLTIPAAWLVWRNLSMATRPWVRRGLWIFLAAHLGTLGYTVMRVLG